MNDLPTEIIIQILKATRFQDFDSVKLTCKNLFFLVIEERKRRLRPILQRFKLSNNTFDRFAHLKVYLSGPIASSLALDQAFHEDSELDLFIKDSGGESLNDYLEKHDYVIDKKSVDNDYNISNDIPFHYSLSHPDGVKIWIYVF